MHRDISPGNIIIYKGRAKLSDFEFAKQYGSGTRTLKHIRGVVSQSPQSL